MTPRKMIAGLGLGDHEEATRRAFALLRNETRSAQETGVERLVRFLRQASSDGDQIYRASSVLEAINRLDSSLISIKVIEELSESDSFSKRSTAAYLLWDRAKVAPNDIPLGLLSRSAVPSTEDWYVQAPAIAATKQLLLRRRAARIVFDGLARSTYAADCLAVAVALIDIMNVDPRAVPGDLPQALANDPDEQVAMAAGQLVTALRDRPNDWRDPLDPFGI